MQVTLTVIIHNNFYFLRPSSSNYLWIQMASLHTCVATIYPALASVVNRATTVCNLDNQLTAPLASVNT